MATPKQATLDHVRQLRQLQEYEITLKEARIMHGNSAALQVVEACITSIRQKLDMDVLSRYDRLSKAGAGVVVVKDGMCMGCNIMIPRGDLNRVQTGTAEPTCPNCGVYIAV